MVTRVVGSKCFRATVVYQLGSVSDYRSLHRIVCQNAICQHRHESAGVWESAPECLHIDGSLEHEESVSAVVGKVVGIDHFTILTKVFGTEYTAVPLSNDTVHIPVAEGKFMCEVTKISCFDADEQLLYTRPRKVMLHTCRITWYVRRGRAAWRRPSGIPISASKNRVLEFLLAWRKTYTTNKIGMIGNSDSSGPGMSTGRLSLRNACIGS